MECSKEDLAEKNCSDFADSNFLDSSELVASSFFAEAAPKS